MAGLKLIKDYTPAKMMMMMSYTPAMMMIATRIVTLINQSATLIPNCVCNDDCNDLPMIMIAIVMVIATTVAMMMIGTGCIVTLMDWSAAVYSRRGPDQLAAAAAAAEGAKQL